MLFGNRQIRLTRARGSRDLNWVQQQSPPGAMVTFESTFSAIMPHFCCAGGCTNSSANRNNLSFHGLPLYSKCLLSVSITKMKRDPRYFSVNCHTKICSEHFTSDDFINPYSTKRRLKMDAVPLIFAWNKEKAQPVERSVLEKLNASRTEEEEATDIAS